MSEEVIIYKVTVYYKDEVGMPAFSTYYSEEERLQVIQGNFYIKHIDGMAIIPSYSTHRIEVTHAEDDQP